MNEVMYQTKKLNQEIKNSNEYNHYVRILNKLKEDEKVYSRLMEFERKNIRIQSMADFKLTGYSSEKAMLNKVEEGILSDLQLAIEVLDD